MNDLKSSFDAADLRTQGAESIAAILPHILANKDTAAAYQLLNLYRKGDDWLPEAMMLLNAGVFTRFEKEQITKRLLSDAPLKKIHPSTNFSKYTCELFALAGRIGFSFPEWRFLAQGFGDEGSLFERYGLQRLKRANDIRDASLPPGHPDRDHFGTGFVKTEDIYYTEFRRAYILCSIQGKTPVTMLIRNNSFFFGRDRLPEPAYVSWDKFSFEEIQDFDETKIGPGKTFQPLQNAFDIFYGNDAIGYKVRALIDLLADFDWESELISDWVVSKAGKPHLKSFMNHALDRQEASGKADVPPFYLNKIGAESAPWRVYESVPASRDTLQKLDTINFSTRYKYVLLSGPNGDFPVHPAVPKTAKSANAPTLGP